MTASGAKICAAIGIQVMQLKSNDDNE